MIFFIKFILADLSVHGTFTEAELNELKNIKIKEMKFEDDKVLLKHDEIELKVEKKELPNFIDLVQNRQRMKNYRDLIKEHSEIKTDSIEKRMKEGKVTYFIIFSEDEKCLTLSKELKEKEIPFFIVNDKKVADEFKVPFPGVFAYNAIENVSYKIKIEHSFGTVLSPILSVLSTESMKYLDNSKLPVFYIFFSNEENQIKNEFKEIALKSKEQVKFSLIKFIRNQTDLTHFEITEEDLPAIVHVNEERHKYKLSKINKKKVNQFLIDFLNKKVEIFMRTEEEPKDQTDLKILVGQTHENYVKNRKNDLLVIYGSERCPHCINLLPTLQKIGQSQKDNKNFDIAYINLEKNDVKIKIDAFPTLILYPYGETEWIKFKSYDRNEKEILKFVKKEGKMNKDLFIEEEEKEIEEDEKIDQQIDKVDPVQEIKEVKEEL